MPFNKSDVSIFVPKETKGDHVANVEFAFTAGTMPLKIVNRYKHSSGEWKTFEVGQIIAPGATVQLRGRLGCNDKGPYLLTECVDVPYDVRQEVAAAAWEKVLERQQQERPAKPAKPATNGKADKPAEGVRLAI